MTRAIAAPWPMAPVAVVGAGPVGQTTALLLARWGVPSVLYDQAAARDPIGSKAICQQRDVLDIWEAAGAGRTIADEGLTWTTARTYVHDRELFSYEFVDPGRSPFPPFVNISQARTEQILDEAIAAEPLISVRRGREVTQVAHGTDDVGINWAEGTMVGQDRASFAVLCTGAHSERLRRDLGIEMRGHSFDDRFLICDIHADLPDWMNERRFYFDPVWNPGRQVLIHPCPDSTFRIDWQVPPDYDLGAEIADGRLEQRIRAIIGDVDYEVVWSTVYRFHSRCADHLRAGRVLLAGDAAHLYAPFGARGLNSGVADAENAAWKIAFAGRGWGCGDLLQSYDDERGAAAAENLDITTATMNFLVPPDEAAQAWRRKVLANAGEDPDMRAQVDSGRLAEPFWYSASPLTTLDRGRPFAGRPERGHVLPPGPGVLLPDTPLRSLPESRLRLLARRGVLILVGPQAGSARLDMAALPAGLPVTVLRLDAIDPDNELRSALAAGPDEVWVVRPDAYVAAVLHGPSPAELTDAIARALGASYRFAEAE